MFSRFKNAVIGVVSGTEVGSNSITDIQYPPLPPKFNYERPHFLNLQEEAISMSADHRRRPIIHPSQPLPHFAGYAECINGGKSRWNEDQAVALENFIVKEIQDESTNQIVKYNIPYTYFALFDGHAGVGAAVAAARQLHHILHEKLVDTIDDVWYELMDPERTNYTTRDSLITGALEISFYIMDQVIAEDRHKYQAAGGCTAIVALIILGSVYIANAGDSRAIVCHTNNWNALSTDFTPEREQNRIKLLGALNPTLLGNAFNTKEYIRRPKADDLGKRIKYRETHMTGWSFKTVTQDDLKPPLISGFAKKSRLMATIGVTRGLGDHDLVSIHSKVAIKPFLSHLPDVRIFRLNKSQRDEVLVMATDGLWDVVSNNTAASLITKALQGFTERQRYGSAAASLVSFARGHLVREHFWQIQDNTAASVDDISVFVIPTLPFKLEFEQLCSLVKTNNTDSLNFNSVS